MSAEAVRAAVTVTVRGTQRGNAFWVTATRLYVPPGSSNRYVPSAPEWVDATIRPATVACTFATTGLGGHGCPTCSTGHVGPAVTRPVTTRVVEPPVAEGVVREPQAVKTDAPRANSPMPRMLRSAVDFIIGSDDQKGSTVSRRMVARVTDDAAMQRGGAAATMMPGEGIQIA